MDFNELKEEKIEFEIAEGERKEKKKRRKEERRRRRQVKFTDKRHSKLAIAAFIIAVLSVIVLVLAIILATKAKGHGGPGVGGLTFLSFALAMAALVCGLLTFKKVDVIYTFAWSAIIIGGVSWLATAWIMILGL